MTKVDDLLIEIGCEELPPNSLLSLSQAFAMAMEKQFKHHQLGFGEIKYFATPRRIALLVIGLDNQQADYRIERRGPSYNKAFDENSQPTPAGLGFAKSCGVKITELDTLESPKGKWLMYRYKQKGQTVQALLSEMIHKSVSQLPIAKLMRWGEGLIEFVRPVHWVVLCYGNETIRTQILGKQSSNKTYGHRFHHPQPITITAPQAYEKQLEQAKVVVDFAKRKALICEQAQQLAKEHAAEVVIESALLNEVTALCEWPVAQMGRFSQQFLSIPSEALIAAMRDHQKCFHLINPEGALLPCFITIANIASQRPEQVIMGNERVMHARLADAAFFYESDRKKPLLSHASMMPHVVFQAELGTLYDKSQRLVNLSQYIAYMMDIDVDQAGRAGMLAKCDLLTNLVAEFPELQGIMGYYYAAHDGEAEAVAIALKEQYLPRFSGDRLPNSALGCTLALADNLDHLVGMFGIYQKPSGEKDPFKLRRSALAIIRILIEKKYDLNFHTLLQRAFKIFSRTLANPNTIADVDSFMIDRLRYYYQAQGTRPDMILAVLAKQSRNLLDFHHRLRAVKVFVQLPAAQSLTMTNKRVSNILREADALDWGRQEIKVEMFEHEAEIQLADMIRAKQDCIVPLCEVRHYKQALTELASLRQPVDRFFDEVMVMVEEVNLRNNRLRLLARLRDLFLQVADISLLQ